jgi:hypothetical protein
MASIKSNNVLVSPIPACFSQQKRTAQVIILQCFLSLVQNGIVGSGSTCSHRIPGDGIECDLVLGPKARSIPALGNAQGTGKPIRGNLLPSSHQSGMSHSAWKCGTMTGNRYPLATVRRHADGHDFQCQISQRKSLYASAFCRWYKTESVLQVWLGNVKRRQGIVTLWQHSGETQTGTIFSVRTVSTSRYIPVSFVAGTKRDVRLNSNF